MTDPTDIIARRIAAWREKSDVMRSYRGMPQTRLRHEWEVLAACADELEQDRQALADELARLDAARTEIRSLREDLRHEFERAERAEDYLAALPEVVAQMPRIFVDDGDEWVKLDDVQALLEEKP